MRIKKHCIKHLQTSTDIFQKKKEMLLIDNWRKSKAYGKEIKSYFYILWIFIVILFQEVCLDSDLFDDMRTSSPIILLTLLLKMWYSLKCN